MLLSVVIYNHKLTGGQWLGAAVVFAGISVEAFVKRKGLSNTHQLKKVSFIHLFLDVHTKRVIQEKEKAKIKSL
jgi:UDP-galactose transporter B1